MKAAVYNKYGPPSVVVLADVPLPSPKAEEVLIRIHATTVSTADWRARSLAMPAGFGPMGRPFFGMFGPRQPILGTELAGEIVATGKAVTRFKVRDHVFAFTGAKYGCHAEYRVMPQDGLIMQKPANLSFEEAAALSFGGTTALYFLKAKAGIESDDSVLVIGASGCIGTAAVQIAKHFGANVTGVCSTANLSLVRRIGADAVIDYTGQDIASVSQTYDIILDTTGTAPYARCGHLLKPGGRLLIAHGTLSTVLGIGGPRRSSGHKSIAGVVKVTIADLRQLADLAAMGTFRPVIDSAYPLENAAEAHAYVDQGHKRGSVVLSVGSSTAQDRTDLVGPRDQLAFFNRQSVLLPQPITALEAWRRIMARPLPGLGVAFALRDAISARFGVKRIGGFSGCLVEIPQVGGHLDFFLIERLEDTMMTLTARDRHLDVMICIEMDGCKINITASVVTHNLFGRLYMIPVAPAHLLIVWLMLRRLLLPTISKSRVG
jgi:NADPH:quinone reductase-like Zn-dependent oxidoreductase